MDQEAVLKNLKGITTLLVSVMILVIVNLVLIGIVASRVGADVDYKIGVSLSISLGIVSPVVNIVLCGIARKNIDTNPKLVFPFSIVTLASMGVTTLAMVYGVVESIDSVIDDVGFIMDIDPIFYSVNLGLHIGGAVCIIIVAILLPFVIIKSIKNMTMSQEIFKEAVDGSSAAAASTTPTKSIKTSSASTKYCSECGAKVREDAKFCENCGTKQ